MKQTPKRINTLVSIAINKPDSKIPFGKYKGSTLEQVRTEDYNYYNWFMTSVLKK